jgi:hypothetical protein
LANVYDGYDLRNADFGETSGSSASDVEIK